MEEAAGVSRSSHVRTSASKKDDSCNVRFVASTVKHMKIKALDDHCKDKLAENGSQTDILMNNI